MTTPLSAEEIARIAERAKVPIAAFSVHEALVVTISDHQRARADVAALLRHIAAQHALLLAAKEALRDLLDNCGASIGTTPAVERARDVARQMEGVK